MNAQNNDTHDAIATSIEKTKFLQKRRLEVGTAFRKSVRNTRIQLSCQERLSQRSAESRPVSIKKVDKGVR